MSIHLHWAAIKQADDMEDAMTAYGLNYLSPLYELEYFTYVLMTMPDHRVEGRLGHWCPSRLCD